MSMILPTLGGSSSKSFWDKLDEMSLFRVDLMVEYAFSEFLYAINENIHETLFVDPAMHFDDPPYTEKECHLKCAVVLLLKDAYRGNRDRVVVPRSVRTVEQIGPALERELEKIRARIAEAADDPRRVVDGQASYQTFPVDGLLVSAQFASRCMDTFQHHYNKIFNSVIKLVGEFFEKVDVYPEIRRDSVTRHPFGRVDEITFGDPDWGCC